MPTNILLNLLAPAGYAEQVRAILSVVSLSASDTRREVQLLLSVHDGASWNASLHRYLGFANLWLEVRSVGFLK